MSNARRKLNAAALRGVLLIARLIAALGRSWTVFWLLAVVLTLSAIYAGDVRLNRPRK
jgi:4-hydroxybenzoate polyprenyltransferase